MKRFDPQRHHRRSIRLPGYDYSQAGSYFVTICAQDRECLFGDVVDGRVVLNDAGWMAQIVWDELTEHYPDMQLDEYVVMRMPNHFHGIVILVGAPLVGALSQEQRAGTTAPTTVAPTLGNIIGAYKPITTDQYVASVKQHGWPPFNRRVWQRNYYEHVVRDDDELDRIREYIATNPARWEHDRENPGDVDDNGRRRRGESTHSPSTGATGREHGLAPTEPWRV
jgi:REP element-mobilizing transposase RayT